jgi:tetratricopeptide (TPR) repeat protein
MSMVASMAATSSPNDLITPVKTNTHASTLSLWCDRFIEAGWLAVIIVAPLFFNIYSSRVFEPDKLTTVRSIALVMATAWLVKWLEERRNSNKDARITWRTPLVLPTLLLVAIYMISTALSVAPRTSLLGSYQRLQGTYTTFSYIIIFLLMLQGMRSRVQLDRLINLIIITSLPIAIYGMLQRANLDPLPWGGDVTQRVAGNMGNAIFIAAYLIMAFFLNLGKIAEAFGSVLTSPDARISDVVRAAIYILIALVNAFVVWALAGSRGPQLGWLVGMFFIVLLLIQLIRRRKLRLGLTLGYIGTGVAGIVFLLMLNFNRTPLFDKLREFRPFGLMSSVIQTDNGTNAVRVLIWEGAVKLVLPHQPLQFPDGRADTFNTIRTLVGYGPESMYVAYNKFYPPDLAHFEARNASPDRSHNETWDSLVITGAIGFLAYMFLFGSFFYFGFKWLGLVTSRFERVLFPVLWVLGGLVGAVGAMSLQGPELFGIGVAAGVALGLVIYLIISVLINTFGKAETISSTHLSLRDQVLIIALISAVVAHFIEIHTGIAIASTRTHFWAYAAMLIVVGMGYLRDARVGETVGDAAPEAAPAGVAPSVTPAAGVGAGTRTPGAGAASRANTASTRRRRAQLAAQANASTSRRSTSSGSVALPVWFNTVAVNGLFLGLMLGILAFDFINNSDRNTNTGQVFWNALTVVKGQPSLGILIMFLITWVLGSLILLADAHRRGTLHIPEHNNAAALTAAFALSLSISLLICIAFGTFIAGRLVDFVAARQNTVDNILGIADQLSAFPAYLYVLIGIIMIVAALLLRAEAPVRPARVMAPTGLAGLFLFVIALWTISTSNLQPIAADIIYKQAAPWDQQGGAVLQQGTNVQGWDVAIEHYRRAIQLAPNEDFYYLWLGRALLEKAKSTQDTQALKTWADNAPFTKVIDDGAENWNRKSNTLPSSALSRDDLLTAARIILTEARVINPLNTDHSANLARMWRQSGDIAADQAVKTTRYENSSQEYQLATTLSPNNSVLWNEWASLYLYSFSDYAKAQEKLDKSVMLDNRYDQTYLLRGELLMQQAAQFDQQRQQAGQVVAQTPVTDTARLNAAKDVQQKADASFKAKLSQARVEFTSAIGVNPAGAQAYNVLTYIDQQLGNLTEAISTTTAYITRNPQDWTGYKNLALLYRDSGKNDLAADAVKKAIALAPADQKASLQTLLDQLTARK